MRSLFLFLSLFMVADLSGQGQTRTRKSVQVTQFRNGRVKQKVTTWITLPVFLDPANYYKKTRTEVCIYDSLTGEQISFSKRVTKIGNDGRPCHELKYKEIRYDSAGRKLWMERGRCDKQRTIRKEYEKGKLVYKRKQIWRKRRTS